MKQGAGYPKRFSFPFLLLAFSQFLGALQRLLSSWSHPAVSPPLSLTQGEILFVFSLMAVLIVAAQSGSVRFIRLIWRLEIRWASKSSIFKKSMHRKVGFTRQHWHVMIWICKSCIRQCCTERANYLFINITPCNIAVSSPWPFCLLMAADGSLPSFF